MRLLIAMMKHETNTFSPVPTDWRRFEDWGLAKATITCDGEGVTTSDNARLNYRNLRRPIHPLDRINEP
ncbi:MAG: M81 family metallopeptidase [Limibaculum sp.]